MLAFDSPVEKVLGVLWPLNFPCQLQWSLAIIYNYSNALPLGSIAVGCAGTKINGSLPWTQITAIVRIRVYIHIYIYLVVNFQDHSSTFIRVCNYHLFRLAMALWACLLIYCWNQV